MQPIFHGLVMTFELPYDDLAFVVKAQLSLLEQISIRKEHIDVNGDYLYFITCDLVYPSHLNELHSQWPLAHEKYEITYNDLSSFSKL